MPEHACRVLSHAAIDFQYRFPAIVPSLKSVIIVWQVWNLEAALAAADEASATGPAQMLVTAAVAAHDKDINAVAVSPNDALVVTASQDRTAKVHANT